MSSIKKRKNVRTYECETHGSASAGENVRIRLRKVYGGQGRLGCENVKRYE
jgi:hypothetical protein